MNEIIWILAKNFSKKEAWGDASKMRALTIWLIQSIREQLPEGCWIKIHCGYKSEGHEKNSFHYKAQAIDFHVVGLSILEAELIIMKYLRESGLVEYIGIGIYPDWANPGFHIDTRGKRASWSRIGSDYLAYSTGIEYIKNNYKMPETATG